MICNCCGEDKKTPHFSYGRNGWTAHCMDCGVWLRLFKARFDPSFWLDDKKTRKSQELIRKEERVENVAQLYGAFGIQFPEDKPRPEICTVLADAAWPYRDAA